MQDVPLSKKYLVFVLSVLQLVVVFAHIGVQVIVQDCVSVVVPKLQAVSVQVLFCWLFIHELHEPQSLVGRQPKTRDFSSNEI